ncbi:PDR/VanB family oxidoreductase [Roseinatronobacter alkalisoli]|uniref:PDR/VanB family oxidoreductase n=1 Tax=Roseinatronobacter alkalisoli TaxID=3028235 RepID=A0ABT5T977_9RHOB|nr:PDR/VanB family oxidoreductase [Roseinatronobacter sp. HJB301]MDD7970727.1 PDR/VanB family oxidoreductase [Roseinatronobacter sp. HJB301]
MSSGTQKIPVIVTARVKLNDLVTRFEFRHADGHDLPHFSGGAHIVVEMRDGDKTRLNPYSLMSDPMDPHHYAISVRRDDQGRGGSVFMHDKVQVGDRMVVSYPVNLFPLDLTAKKHLMIAGGIGITPFMSQIRQLERLPARFELHYAVRSAALASYADDLRTRHPLQVHVYHDDQGERIALETLLRGQPLGTHIYVCGPRGMIDWVLGTATELGWPATALHYEEFLAPQSGTPFVVELAASGKTVTVGEHESLLEAIERAGVDAPYMCRGGACGQCETRVIRHDGTILHNDHWLEEEEHASGEKIMPCVSRFDGKTLVLDR